MDAPETVPATPTLPEIDATPDETEGDEVECPRCGKRHRNDPPRLVTLAELSFEVTDPEIGNGPLRVMYCVIGVMTSALTEEETRERVAIHDDSELVEQLRELAEWGQSMQMAEAVRERQAETPEQRAAHLREWDVDPLTVDLNSAEAVQDAINSAAARNHIDRIENSRNDD